MKRAGKFNSFLLFIAFLKEKKSASFFFCCFLTSIIRNELFLMSQEEKSRVLKYADLRTKISRMDVYSFTETKTTRKNLPKHNLAGSPASLETPSESLSDPKIKKNTLSLTIDELLNEKSDRKKETSKKLARKEARKKKRAGRVKISSRVVIFAVLITLAILFFVLLALFLLHVL